MEVRGCRASQFQAGPAAWVKLRTSLYGLCSGLELAIYCEVLPELRITSTRTTPRVGRHEDTAEQLKNVSAPAEWKFFRR